MLTVQNYRINPRALLGKGAFAKVYLATNVKTPGVYYACKVIEKDDLSRTLEYHIIHEINISS